MSSRSLFIFMASIFPFFAAKASGPSEVIAHIGQTEVRAEELRPFIAALSPQDQASIMRDPDKFGQFVRSVLLQRILLQEALSKKWDQQPKIVAQLKQVRENKIVDTYVESVTMVPESFPSESEIQAAYDAAKPAMLTMRQYRLAQIFIATPAGMDPALLSLAQAKMEKVQQELQKPNADFASLATLSSDEKSSAARGGEIGWVTAAQVQPDMREQFSSLKKGTISPPLRLVDGWHILKCLEIKEPYTLPLSEVRAQLIQQLRLEKARAAAKIYLEQLAQTSALTVDNTALAKFVKK